FNLEPAGVPIPSPYQYLTYTGFEINTGPPSPHLIAPLSTGVISISIGLPAQHFNLTSVTLACSSPPCNITMWGTKVAATTAQGAAAGTLLTSMTRVEAVAEGVSAFTVVDGLLEKGWVHMDKVSFVAKGDAGEGLGLAIDDLVYTIRMEKGCKGEEGKMEEARKGDEDGKEKGDEEEKEKGDEEEKENEKGQGDEQRGEEAGIKIGPLRRLKYMR
ncbi:MAG: hypothetical protein Q9224_007112, partial [Gallowayella concinna]